MRVIEDSPARLRLRETTGYLPVILGVAAIVIAIFVVVRRENPKQLINSVLFGASAVFFRREARITLDKSARRCGIWRQDMWRRSYRTVPFDDIQDVQVEIETPDTDALIHSRLSLLTGAGSVPLTAGFSATLDWQISLREKMVDVIFLGRPRPAQLDRTQLLLNSGRPFAAARRA